MAAKARRLAAESACTASASDVENNVNKRKKEKNSKTAVPAASSQLEQPMPDEIFLGHRNNKNITKSVCRLMQLHTWGWRKGDPWCKLPKKETRAALGDDGVRPLSLESRFEEAAVAVDKPGGTTPFDPSFKQGAQ